MRPDLIRSFYAALGIELRRTWSLEAQARCFARPEHHHRGDLRPSTSVNLESGAWFCHGCGAGGGPYDAAILRGRTRREAMELLRAHGLIRPRSSSNPTRPATSAVRGPSGRTFDPSSLLEADLDQWAGRLEANQAFLQVLQERRGFTTEVLLRYGVGLDRGRLTIPIRDARSN